ncbi:MAG: hypothetical protein KF739_07475 [Cryobacterium sp.]|nr:hypothetical protein [Cryobacterium sp.]
MLTDTPADAYISEWAGVDLRWQPRASSYRPAFADSVLVDGWIYTAGMERPAPAGIAVAGDRIMAVAKPEVSRIAGPKTTVRTAGEPSFPASRTRTHPSGVRRNRHSATSPPPRAQRTAAG